MLPLKRIPKKRRILKQTNSSLFLSLTISTDSNPLPTEKKTWVPKTFLGHFVYEFSKSTFKRNMFKDSSLIKPSKNHKRTTIPGCHHARMDLFGTKTKPKNGIINFDLRSLEKNTMFSPKWWLNGDIPWLNVNNHLKLYKLKGFLLVGGG